MVEVAQPNGSFITGGGFLVESKSAGTYTAAPGTKTNFGFNVNYKNLKSLQAMPTLSSGQAAILTRSRVRPSTRSGSASRIPRATAPAAARSARPATGLAGFRAKANLTDVTDPLAPASLEGNLTLEITLTDKGEPGSSDTIAITLWNGSKLLFSSSWSGSKPVQETLGGGNLVGH
jgi:hypothetical protein